MTAIEWTDVTWNCIRGCSRVSEGCRHCYAEKIAARFSDPGKPFDGFASRNPSRWTGRVELVPEKLEEPLRWRKPRRVFVNSMSDLFHEDLTADALRQVWDVMRRCPQHTFQILTKRAAGMRDTFDWVLSDDPLPNVWLGVSCEDQKTADERIPLLLQTPAAMRFVSLEPLLGPIDLTRLLVTKTKYTAPELSETSFDSLRGMGTYPSSMTGIPIDTFGPPLDWVIVGGESGPGARPCDVAWIRDIVRQCKAAGTRTFVKQVGAHVIDRNDAGFDADEETFADGPNAGRSTKPRSWPTPWDIEHDVNGCREEYQGAPVRVVLRDRKGGDPAEWPEDIRVREFPGAGA